MSIKKHVIIWLLMNLINAGLLGYKGWQLFIWGTIIIWAPAGIFIFGGVALILVHAIYDALIGVRHAPSHREII